MRQMTPGDAIAILCAREDDLRAAGVRSLRIFGSMARDEAESEIDLEAAFEDASPLTLLKDGVLERVEAMLAF